MVSRVKDQFYKKAKIEGYLARSAYKLMQIDKKYKLFKSPKVGTIIEFGISPGSWYQYYSQLLSPQTYVIGVDQKLFKTTIQHGMFLERDILELTPEDLRPRVQGQVRLVLSDALHNVTGNRIQDQARADELRNRISELVLSLLAVGGNVVIKVYETPALEPWVRKFEKHFHQSRLEKPEASRQESAERYFVGMGYHR